MHEMFKFPLECRYTQRVYRKLSWKEGCLGPEGDRYSVFTISPDMVGRLKAAGQCPAGLEDKTERDLEPVLHADEKREYSTYEAFNSPGLIPSIHSMVRNARSGQGRQSAAKRWIEKHGFLGCNVPPHETLGGWAARASWESLNDFWSEAEALSDLWEKYKQITQRDLSAMREWIRFAPRPQLGGAQNLLLWPEGFQTKASFSPLDPPGTESAAPYTPFFEDTVAQIEANALSYYQLAGITHVRHCIEQKMAGIKIAASTWQQFSTSQDDIFKTKPVIQCRNLLQAMYLQFFLMLSDTGTKKICLICGRLFQPSRTDRVYCDSACYNTAKSQRFRGRKKTNSLQKK